MMQRFPNTIPAFLGYFLKPRFYFVTLLLSYFVLSLITIVQAYLLKKLIDDAGNFLGNERMIAETMMPGIVLILVYIFNNEFWHLVSFMNYKILPQVNFKIMGEVTDYVHGHSYRFFQENQSGSISTNISELANQTILLFQKAQIISMEGFAIILIIIFSSIASPIFSLIFLAWATCFLVIGIVFRKKIEYFSSRFISYRNKAIGGIVDSLSNAINFILYAREDYEKKYINKLLSSMEEQDAKLQKTSMNFFYMMGVMIVLMQVLIISSLIYLGSIGKLTIGDFTLIFIFSVNITNRLWIFTQELFKMHSLTGIINEYLSFFSLKHEVVDRKDSKLLKVNEGTIVFSRVNFFYGDAHKLFQDKTLAILGKEKVGLVGESGSGKTTFINLITRTFDIQKGDILIDNQSIYSVTLKSLRDNISFIPQEPSLFHRSVIENIRYANLQATDEEVIEAAKKAHVHEFAMKLPSGYKTVIGERGFKLSGGQKQRIAIARAILKDAPILILDEATSALDSVTESLIKSSLEFVMRNKTVIVIAHRLSTIKAMDRIIVFSLGKIVEEGTHEYLLKKGEIYQNLWQIQRGQLND